MYNERLLDHFQNPRNVGELPAPAIVVNVINPACGDTLRLSAIVQDGRVVEVAYKMRGCTAAVAAGSALTELITGRTVADVASLTTRDIDDELGGLPAESSHVASLCIDGIKALLRSIRK